MLTILALLLGSFLFLVVLGIFLPDETSNVNEISDLQPDLTCKIELDSETLETLKSVSSNDSVDLSEELQEALTEWLAERKTTQVIKFDSKTNLPIVKIDGIQ